MGADKPRDLGVRYTQDDYDSALAKLGLTIDVINNTGGVEDSIRFSGENFIDARLTQEEITALLNNKDWKYYPYEDVQVKIGEDGVIETSFLLDLEKFPYYARAMNVSDGDIDLFFDTTKISGKKKPIYIRGEGGVEEGQVNLEIDKVEAGRLPLSKKIYDEDNVEEFIEDEIDFIPGLDVESASALNGEALFSGSVPEVVEVEGY